MIMLAAGVDARKAARLSSGNVTARKKQRHASNSKPSQAAEEVTGAEAGSCGPKLGPFWTLKVATDSANRLKRFGVPDGI
jgi:hypothetical protein